MRLARWKECFDADSAKNLGVDIREYFIPDLNGREDKASCTQRMLHVYQMTIKRLTLKGDKAIVTYRKNTQGLLSGPGMAHPKTLFGTSLKTAVWKKYGGHWLIAAEPEGD